MFHMDGPKCNGDESCPPGMHYYFDYATETESEAATVENLMNSVTCRMKRSPMFTSTGAFFGLSNYVTIIGSNNKQKVSTQANQRDFLQKRIDACSKSALTDSYNPAIPKTGDVNFLYVDFWSLGDVVEVVQSHNRALGTRGD